MLSKRGAPDGVLLFRMKGRMHVSYWRGAFMNLSCKREAGRNIVHLAAMAYA
jgi:hypothetical protein